MKDEWRGCSHCQKLNLVTLDGSGNVRPYGRCWNCGRGYAQVRPIVKPKNRAMVGLFGAKIEAGAREIKE